MPLRRYGCRLKLDAGVLSMLVDAAEKSGRFAHAVSEFIEREIRLPVMDRITRTDRKLNLRVRVEKNRVRIDGA